MHSFDGLSFALKSGAANSSVILILIHFKTSMHASMKPNAH